MPRTTLRFLGVSAIALAAIAAQPAWAQTAPQSPSPAPADAIPTGDQSAPPADDQSSDATKDIVVTGTLIRGIAPVGTNVIGLSKADIASTGATSTQQLLANVPQITNAFNATPSIGTGVSGLTIVRPNIRNLAANGGNTTLVLLDGHNLVGAGILQTTPDVGVIPPGALERIDVVADGGSSLYGSDAIGGIVNLITRKKMDGVELSGHIGTSPKYLSGDINVTAGKSWSTGSFLASYAYRANSDILGADRSYFRKNLAPFGGTDNSVIACNPGTISANGTTYALPGRVAGTSNRCDTDLFADLFPAEKQNSFFASFTQDLGSAATFSMTGFYTDRRTKTGQAQRSTSNATITNANPYFQSIAGETSQQVSFNYASARGPTMYNRTSIEEFQVTPQLVYDVAPKWKVTLLGNFGRSITTGHTFEINPVAEAAALAGTTTATALNPYDPGSSNPSVLSNILDYEQFARNKQTLAEGRVVVDGSLITLPGGDVRLAVGGQYQFTKSDAVQTDAPIGDLTNAARAAASRNVYSVFGELVVPIFGNGNAIPGMRSLVLDGSVRYDHYSDFGGTTNPKIGLTWKPFDALTIRGNYGTSFNAHSLADTAGAVDTRAQVLGVSPFQQNFSLANLFRPTILLAGGNPNLKPQTANTYSVGADFKPARWLVLSATYWNVSLKNVIEVTPFYSPTIFTNPALSGYFIINPTLAQAQALIGNQRVQGPSLATLYGSGNAPYAIFDAHRNNLGTLKTDGIDFNAAVNVDTSIGAVSASVGGTYYLNRTSTIAGSAPFDELANNGISPLQLSGSIGDKIGGLSARVRVDYSAGYPFPGIVGQSRVKAFAPVNLYFAYDFAPSGSLHGVQVTLNVDNVGNARPPFLNRVADGSLTDGFANGATFGRFINVGMNMKF